MAAVDYDTIFWQFISIAAPYPIIKYPCDLLNPHERPKLDFAIIKPGDLLIKVSTILTNATEESSMMYLYRESSRIRPWTNKKTQYLNLNSS